MVREVIRFEVLYGQYTDALEICHEIDAQVKALKLPTARYLVPVTGKANIVILETEYKNFADYEKANEAFYSSQDVMKNVRRLAAITVQGSSITELYEDAPTIA